jgi:hypothetical protein
LQPTVPPGATPPPGAAAPPAVDPAWLSRFLKARELLVRGYFDQAAVQLDALARTAPDPVSMARAMELATLGRQWTLRGLVLRPEGAPPAGEEDKEKEKREDKRTIDELAILYTDAAVWGTGFGFTVGLSVRDAAPAHYFLPAIGMSLAGAGAVAALDLSGDRRLRYGVPHSITAGLYTGLEAGFFAAMTANGFSDRGPSAGAFAGTMWGGATAGALAGGLIGDAVGTTPGRASLVQSGAMWGGLITTLVTIGACGDGGGCIGKAPWIAGLTGMTAAAVGGGFLGSTLSPSIARVRFMDLGAFGGGLVVGGIYASIASSRGFDMRAFSLLTAAGTSAGLVGIGFATNKMDRDEPRRQRGGAVVASMRPTFIPFNGGGGMGLTGTLW